VTNDRDRGGRSERIDIRASAIEFSIGKEQQKEGRGKRNRRSRWMECKEGGRNQIMGEGEKETELESATSTTASGPRPVSGVNIDDRPLQLRRMDSWKQRG
jgi:hypothetical protein